LNTKSIKRHIELSTHYFANSQQFLELNEIEKASEFLWGSIAQAIKAVAAIKGYKLLKHDDLKNYTWELSRELKDEGVWYSFIEAQSQHSNFYESGLTKEDIAKASERIKSTLNILNSLIFSQSKEKTDG
jgi:hypothetical protein